MAFQKKNQKTLPQSHPGSESRRVNKEVDFSSHWLCSRRLASISCRQVETGLYCQNWQVLRVHWSEARVRGSANCTDDTHLARGQRFCSSAWRPGWRKKRGGSTLRWSETEELCCSVLRRTSSSSWVNGCTTQHHTTQHNRLWDCVSVPGHETLVSIVDTEVVSSPSESNTLGFFFFNKFFHLFRLKTGPDDEC